MSEPVAASNQYESAGGVVVTPTGDQVLVLFRGKRSGPNGRPEVRLPKGHIEAGESRQQAALREVYEESGLTGLEILSDLGYQQVRFVFKGMRYVRDESYFLMTVPREAEHEQPEKQFERLWLTWSDASSQLTFDAEREWIRRAHLAWDQRLENVADQDTEKANNNAQVQEDISLGEEE
jgi:8-oxo-dGTP pyrophosphatase MutT (NUDIX family)